jgi:hypothetical protein
VENGHEGRTDRQTSQFEPSKNVFRDDFEKVEVKSQQDEHGWLVVWNIWIIFSYSGDDDPI